MRVGGMHGGLGWQVHTEVRVLGRWLQHRELYPVSAARRPTRERIRMHVRPRKTGGASLHSRNDHSLANHLNVNKTSQEEEAGGEPEEEENTLPRRAAP